MDYTKLGATGLEVAALALRLTDAEVRRLEEPYRPHPVVGVAVGR